MKKNHSQIEAAVNKITLSDSFADHPLIQWISNNGRNLLWGLAGAIAIFLLIYRFAGGASSGGERDYLSAENEFIIFQKGVNGKPDSASQKTAYNNLVAILKRRPELHAKYDGPIAQILIDRGDISEAQPYASRTLDRTSSDNINYYSDFAKTTLLIADQKYKEALKQALDLKQQMIDSAAATVQNPDQKGFGDSLFAYNLLRIAFLSQQIGDIGREQEAWDNFTNADKANSNLYTVNAEALEAAYAPFTEGETTLNDYIQAREKTLKLPVK